MPLLLLLSGPSPTPVLLLGKVTVADMPAAGIQMNAPNLYDIDTRIRLTALFVNALTGAPADPTAVEVFIKAPSAKITESGAVTRDSVGAYHYDFTADEVGPWIYKFQGTGAIEVSSSDAYLFVRQTVFTLTP